MTRLAPNAAAAPAGSKKPGASPVKARAGRIIIARHGRPALDRDAGPRLDWRAYRDWWAQYEAGSLAPGQTPPKRLVELGRGARKAFSSMRPRAIETARLILGDMDIESDPIFNEAPLPPPQWGGVRYLPRTWNKLARASWMLGHAGGEEPASETRARAVQAASRLIAEAEQGGDVLLAAHGWFNRMLRPPLRARGWVCVRDGGDSYWSYRVYRRRGG